MKLMSDHNKKLVLHYVMLKILSWKVAGNDVTGCTQCLPINFNIFNHKKYCVA